MEKNLPYAHMRIVFVFGVQLQPVIVREPAQKMRYPVIEMQGIQVLDDAENRVVAIKRIAAEMREFRFGLTRLELRFEDGLVQVDGGHGDPNVGKHHGCPPPYPLLC